MISRAHRLRTAAVLTATLLPATLLAQPALSAPLSPERYSQQAVKLTNEFRSDSGLTKLGKSTCLQTFATKHAQRMANKHRLYHQDLDPIFDACGLRMAGENISAGYTSGRATVRGWMGSEFHRANILNPQYRVMAVAARKSGNQWYAVQIVARLM